MRDTKLQSPAGLPRELVGRQHGVVTRSQLLALGFGAKVVAHRVRSGRLHPIYRGVYAVGRPQLDSHGRWMAAVLACGPGALLSHLSAGALWAVLPFSEPAQLHVSVAANVYRRVTGVVVHRRSLRSEKITRYDGIPVTDAVTTLIDLATTLTARQLEIAINEADKHGLVSPDQLRSALREPGLRHGAPSLRAVLDRHTFALTDSELERLFLPIARAAGLPLPQTGRAVNGFNVDFFWPDLGLIVETDGLRYHRTPAAQARDRLRDQAHAAAGLTSLRFTHAQVAHHPTHVKATLVKVAGRLSAAL